MVILNPSGILKIIEENKKKKKPKVEENNPVIEETKLSSGTSAENSTELKTEKSGNIIDKPVFLRNADTGRITGVQLPDGRSFVGIGSKESRDLAQNWIQKQGEMSGVIEGEEAAKIRKQEQTKQLFLEQAPQIAEERGIFKEPVQERIIPPNQENLGVMTRIASSLIPESIKRLYNFFDLEKIINEKQLENIPQTEITMLEDDLKNAVNEATSEEIDKRIKNAEITLVKNGGIPLSSIAGGLGGVIVGGAILSPTKEFVGTDGQIQSLELALSQYNEMITIPASSVEAGLSPEIAYDKLDKMEEDILALEQQLKISAQTSPKVALALKGRAIEARLFKLKTKLQAARIKIFYTQTQEAFGEKEVSDSLVFLRRLQNGKRR